MRSAVATRRQFLTAGSVALAGAVLSSTAASAMLRSPSASATEPPPYPPPQAGEGVAPTATPTPAPTPATVTIPVPVYQQILDCVGWHASPLLLCRTFGDA